MIPRKLVETFFRRWPVLLAPVLILPVVGSLLVDTPVEYESSARVWVSDLQTQEQSNSSDQTASERQAEVLSDLLATTAFRTDVAVAAGLVAVDAAAADLDHAAWRVGRAVRVSPLGPSLLGVTAVTSNATEAQKMVEAVLAQYQLRLEAETDRQAGVVLDYFQKQLAAAQSDLSKLQAELASYVKTHPTATDPATVDADYLALKSKVDAQTNVVDRLNASLQATQLETISGSTELSTFVVQDAPDVPAAPLTPSLTSKLAYPAAGLFLGLVAATAYLYICYRADHTVRSSEDLRGLGAPVLGFVPELRPRKRLVMRALRLPSFRRRDDYARGVATSLTPMPERAGGELR
ncbi:MAG: hypothetical protein IT303_01115 [Dehalococcoidia bacterium]|nr:hypothetical protein [Dehalococcoidia bacterium]